MDAEMGGARDAFVQVIGKPPFLTPWAFEFTPASAEHIEEGYLRKVREADLVVWLAGSKTTEPVYNEVREALANSKRLLAFTFPTAERDGDTQRLLAEVRRSVKTRDVTDLSEFREQLTLSIRDEVIRAFRESHPRGEAVAMLEQAGRDSRARCITRWITVGIDYETAASLADDPGVGAVPLTAPPRPGELSVFVGDVGIGKSLAAERLFQAAVGSARVSSSSQWPVFLRARDIHGSLQAAIAQYEVPSGRTSRTGVLVVVDGLDEIELVRAIGLLDEAREFVISRSRSTVLATSRPVPGLRLPNDAVRLSPLDESQALALAASIAGREDIPRYSLTPPVLDAIKRPLFALMLGVLLRDRAGAIPASEAELVRALISKVLDRVDGIARPGVEEALQALGARFVDTGGPVDPGDIGLTLAIERELVGTRLVVEDRGSLHFPLVLFAQWFAAHSLRSGVGPAVADLVRDGRRLELWTESLVLAVGVFGFEDATRLLGVLAEQRSDIFAQVLVRAVPQYQERGDPRPMPSEVEIGRMIRRATESQVAGLGAVRVLLPFVRRDGSLLPLGVGARSGPWITTAWSRAADSSESVIELERIRPSDPEWGRLWLSYRAATPSRVPAWPWRWGFDEIRDVLKRLLEARALPTDNPVLATEAGWHAALVIMGRGSLENRPILLEPLIDRIQRISPTTGLIRKPGQRRPASMTSLTASILKAQMEGRDAIEPPWPGPDGPLASGGWIWSPYSKTALLERTRAVYSGAVEAYLSLARQWFQPLVGAMPMAGLAPFQLEGTLQVQDSERARSVFPGLHWRARPLAGGVESAVAIELSESKPSRDLFDLAELQQEIRRLRPDAPASVAASGRSEALEVFGPTPATHLVYRWLFDDLGAISWTDGHISYD